MRPTITVLEDIAAGLDVERQSVELHLAFGHIGHGHGNFPESEKWSADTARFLLPYARAALANIGDPMDADTIAALRVLVRRRPTARRRWGSTAADIVSAWFAGSSPARRRVRSGWRRRSASPTGSLSGAWR